MFSPTLPPQLHSQPLVQVAEIATYGMRLQSCQATDKSKTRSSAGDLWSLRFWHNRAWTSAKNRHRRSSTPGWGIAWTEPRDLLRGQGLVGWEDGECSDSPWAPRLSLQQIFIQQIVIVLESAGASNKNKTQPLTSGGLRFHRTDTWLTPF